MKARKVTALLLILALVCVFSGCAEQTEQTAAPGQSPSSEPSAEPIPAFALESLEMRQGDVVALEDCYAEDVVPDGAMWYASSDETVALVNEQREIVAIGVGECTISVVNENASGELKIEVTGMPEAPGVHIEQAYLALEPGQEGQLSCRLTREVQGQAVWSSNDESVATVDSQGRVVAVGKGTARVSAQAGEYQDSVAVWVTSSKPYAPLGEITAPRFQKTDGIWQNPEASDTGEASILLTGDLMCLSSQQYAAKTSKSHNYNSSFRLVRPIFAEGDFVVGNLETCLSYSSPYTAAEKTVQDNPHCNAQATFLDAVRYAGWDAVVTANNHAGDTGTMGLYETVQMLDTYLIAHTGTFTQAGEPRFLLANVNGIKVAVLSYTEILNTKYGELAIPDAQKSLLIRRYSEENVRADVAAAHEAGAEFIIAYNHWGVENTHDYTQKQVEHAQQMADAGVDFIAGSHSHCLQGPKIFTAADGRSVPCIFSMGNFVSGMGREINNDTIILKLDLARKEDGIELQNVGYIPCKVFVEYGDGHHVVVPTSSALNGGKSSSSLSAAHDRIVKVMRGEEVFTEIRELG